MNNTSKIWIFVAAFIGMLIIYFALFYEGKKRYDWKENYALDKELPFGTWLVSELLKEYKGDADFKQLDSPLDRSLDKAKTPSNYVFIGEEIYLENTSVDSLLSFVSKGNNAFLFTIAEPVLLLEKLLAPESSDTLSVIYENSFGDSAFSSFEKNFVSSPEVYSISYLYKREVSNYQWMFLKDTLVDSRIEFIGNFASYAENGEKETGINYYKIAYKKGAFYFHTQPISFSNITLKEKKLVEYANQVFAYLNEGPILWDEYNWRFNKPNPKTWLYKPNFLNTGEGPLRFVLSNPPLKWAWYILLLFILIFVLFNGKRRKGIIPVLADRTNTSLEHLKRVSVLYKKDENHYVISVKMFENFLGFLQNELKINLDQSREKIIDEIVFKRKIEREYVQKIFDRWKYIDFSKTAKPEIFTKFNKELNSFYERIKK